MKPRLPNEADLNITAKDVEWDRKFIKEYEEAIKRFEIERDSSEGRRRGAYKSQITQKKRALDAMSGNLAYHLAWLKKYKPEVYEEVMKG
jgi:sugar (pentulose or hexulose) kinase